ncbi:ssDNA endonuclease and repair protein rad10 [Saitozyma podzolica]|uniref:SsDNA endonuclease and repair protein rad10 n=1 Tax=Saitozyma podzolica TaxID=1890683 RepID=A0A427YVP3_9TREE|nr:ssDNA endonuclease and repair protein rad10 [Saitozyma podzolica]
MQPPPAASGSDNSSTTSLPGLQRASELARPAQTPRTAPGGSMRNASGGLPPIPKPIPNAGSMEGASVTRSVGDAESSSGQAKEPGALGAGASEPPAKPVNRPAASKNAIVYSAVQSLQKIPLTLTPGHPVQRRNPVLHAIKNVSTEVGDIVADYQVGTHNGVLFLSLKYHRLHPEYIHQRVEKMRNMYNVRILMVLCDISEHQASLRELAKYAIINDYTMFVAWSNDEVAQYLATFKSYEHKSADTLKERVHQVYHDQLQHVLTSGKKVNKTDADNLAAQFGSFANITRQPSKVLSNVKGLGATKVTSLVDAFNKPFLVGGLKRTEDDKGASTSASASTSTSTIMRRTEIVTPALDEAGIGQDKSNGRGAGAGKGKERVAGIGEEATEVEGQGSPDWPDEEDDEGQDDEESAAQQRRPRSPSPRGRLPSRSPGLSPGPRPPEGSAWRDPLDDEDEDEDEDEDGEEDGRPAAKRPRV